MLLIRISIRVERIMLDIIVKKVNKKGVGFKIWRYIVFEMI